MKVFHQRVDNLLHTMPHTIHFETCLSTILIIVTKCNTASKKLMPLLPFFNQKLLFLCPCIEYSPASMINRSNSPTFCSIALSLYRQFTSLMLPLSRSAGPVAKSPPPFSAHPLNYLHFLVYYYTKFLLGFHNPNFLRWDYD